MGSRISRAGERMSSVPRNMACGFHSALSALPNASPTADTPPRAMVTQGHRRVHDREDPHSSADGTGQTRERVSDDMRSPGICLPNKSFLQTPAIIVTSTQFS